MATNVGWPLFSNSNLQRPPLLSRVTVYLFDERERERERGGGGREGGREGGRSDRHTCILYMRSR